MGIMGIITLTALMGIMEARESMGLREMMTIVGNDGNHAKSWDDVKSLVHSCPL